MISCVFTHFNMVLILILVAFTLSKADDIVVGPVTITEDGVKQTRWVVAEYPKTATTNDTFVMVQHNGAVQIAKSNTSEWSADMYVEYKLHFISYFSGSNPQIPLESLIQLREINCTG